MQLRLDDASDRQDNQLKTIKKEKPKIEITDVKEVNEYITPRTQSQIDEKP